MESLQKRDDQTRSGSSGSRPSRLVVPLVVMAVLYSAGAIYLLKNWDSEEAGDPIKGNRESEQRLRDLKFEMGDIPGSLLRTQLEATLTRFHFRAAEENHELVVRSCRYILEGEPSLAEHQAILRGLVRASSEQGVTPENKFLFEVLIRGVNDKGILGLEGEVTKMGKDAKRRQVREFLEETPGLSEDQKERIESLATSKKNAREN